MHSNTSVVLAGAGGAALARVPHVWHVREIYARFGRGLAAVPLGATERRSAALRLARHAPRSSLGRDRVRVIPDGLATDPRAGSASGRPRERSGSTTTPP